MSFRPIDLQALFMQLQQAANGVNAQKHTLKNRELRYGDKVIKKSQRSKEHVDTIDEAQATDVQIDQKKQQASSVGHHGKHISHETHPTIVDKQLGKRIDINK